MRALALLALLVAGACDHPKTACVVPDSVPILNDGGAGCSAFPSVGVCEEHDDGTQTCKNLCTSEEYGLGCYGFVTPDDSLHCKLEPLLPPIGGSLYCCPCAP